MHTVVRALAIAGITAGLGLAAIFGFHYYERLEYETRKADADKVAAAEAVKRESRTKVVEELLDTKVPPSEWLKAERKLFSDAIRAAKPKIVVVPPMAAEGHDQLDATARITIARLLADAIDPTKGPIADPELIFRALGEPRQAAAQDVRQAAYGAEWTIQGRAWRDDKGRMTVLWEMRSVSTPSDGPPEATVEQRNIEVSLQIPPEAAFAPLAMHAAKALGLSTSAPASPLKNASAIPLPATALQAQQRGAESTHGLWLQQLLAVLHIQAETSEYARPQERIFERTLAALLAAPAGGDDRNLLLARAYAYLGRRVAALGALDSVAESAEKRAMAAMLAADLPRMQAAIEAIKRPVPRLIAELELARMAYFFDALPKEARQRRFDALAKNVPEAWHPLIGFYLFGLDAWDYPSPAHVKTVLDRDFPVFRYSLEDIMRGRAALGAGPFDEKLEIDAALSPLAHVRKWREANATMLCCRRDEHRGRAPIATQYLDLLEATADGLTFGRIYFLRQVQGRPGDAMRLADLFDSSMFHGGSPRLLYHRLRIQADLAPKAPAAEQSRVLAADIFESARKVSSWDQSQSYAAANAWLNMRFNQNAYLQHKGYGSLSWKFQQRRTHPGQTEFPRRSLWMDIALEAALGQDKKTERVRTLEIHRQACESTLLQIYWCKRYIDLLERDKSPDAEAQLAKQIENRFIGSVERIRTLAESKQKRGDHEGVKRLVSEAARMPGASGELFTMLSDLQIAEGEFQTAAESLLAYPGFKQRSDNVVALSNYAGKGGYELARRGAIAQASRLLDIAAGNNDGSAWNLWSQAQRALNRSEFIDALNAHQRAYQRYGAEISVRPLVSLLFLIGAHDAAWQALRETLPNAQVFSPYRALAVAFRATAASNERIVEWATELSKNPGVSYRGGEFLRHAASQARIIDRDADAIRKAAATDQAIREVLDQGKYDKLPEKARNALKALEKSNQPLREYAGAYAAFKEGKHEAAIVQWEMIDQASAKAYFPLRLAGEADTYFARLPLMAISLAKLNRLGDVRALVQRRTMRSAAEPPLPPNTIDTFAVPAFELALLETVIHAFAGDHAAGEQTARLALGRLPEPETRLIPPEYALAEVMEALTAETGHRGYVEYALRFVEGFQRYEPWAAWAYAFEAKNTTDASRRVRAAAMALHLDPASERLHTLDETVVQEARAWLKTHPPGGARRGPRSEAGKA